MDKHQSESLARGLLSGEISIKQFVNRVTASPTARLTEANLDLDRIDRCGTAEVIFGEGKSIEALKSIAASLQKHGQGVLITRISPEQAAPLTQLFPEADYRPVARTFSIGETSEGGIPPWSSFGRVCVVSAGTSDQPVAEEACVTASWVGVSVDAVYDVGVAGPHRLLEQMDTLRRADAVVVVAGMEAALASVVGGHLACPIVAVPTSVGYGANFGGVAALLSVLNSCAANVSAVNIDAGFKGGYIAGLVAKEMAMLRYQHATEREEERLP